MTLDLRTLKPEPKRFGECQVCPYRDTGNAAICYSCAIRDIEPLTGAGRCSRCELPLGANGECENYVCGWPKSREFERNYAVGLRTGRLKAVGNAYKLNEIRGWALILSRILVGYMDANADVFRRFDLIIPTPGFTGKGAARTWDHAAEVIKAAAAEAGRRWPFETTPVIVRTGPVPPLKEKKWKERRQIVETQLRESLRVLDPRRVAAKRVLVYDDIFTDGMTLKEVARALRASGARSVTGLTLMRQPRGAS